MKMVNTTTRTKREVVTWVILVLSSMAAALVITFVSEKLNNSPAALGDESNSAWQPNFRQVLLSLGYDYFIVFLKVFVVLGLGRVIFLFKPQRRRDI